MKKILCLPKGILKNRKEKDKIEAAGFIIIECDDPEKVKIITETERLSASDLSMAALGGLIKADSTFGNREFVNTLFQKLLQADKQS